MKTQTTNIVLIMTDTQPRRLLGCYGNSDMHTPHLDALAQGGMRFDQAYCCQPVCGPARAGIFTGLAPHSAGCWANAMPLGDTVKTIGQRLHAHGVHTAYIGKWHLDGGDYFGTGQCPAGWDARYWYDMHCYLEELTPEERRRSRRTETNADPHMQAEFTFAHRCSNRAVQFLQRHAQEPFFLVVSYDEPHGPCLCPRPFADMYRTHALAKPPNVWDTLENKPEHQRVWAQEAQCGDRNALQIKAPDYLGCNAFVDDEIGRVLAAIDAHAPDTLILYTSDHGDMLYAHGLTSKGPAMYDEITRIPLIARWPSVIPPGSVCAHPVSHLDLAPTVLSAAGLAPSKVLQGTALQPALRDPAARVNDAVFMEFGRYEVDHDGFGGFQPIRCVCDGRYKLVINLLTSDELYDLVDDPGETVNHIASPAHTSVRNRLHDRLLEWMNTTRDPFRGYYWERRPWRHDARPATWLYTGMTRQPENEINEPRQLDYDTGLEMTAAVRKK